MVGARPFGGQEGSSKRITAYVNLFSQVCPLTPLENRFRYLAGQAGYEGGFIEHYIAPRVYPGVTPERWGL
jgi:hypothetical protein